MSNREEKGDFQSFKFYVLSFGIVKPPEKRRVASYEFKVYSLS
jgi:hypothetical protein